MTSTHTPDVRSHERHAPWCDLRQHITEEEATDQGQPDLHGCVSGSLGAEGIGGWITATGGREPMIVLDWSPPRSSRADGFTPHEAAELIAFLATALAELNRGT